MNNNNLEEANCTSSGTTTEEDQQQHKPDIVYKCGDLNLDLSIGLEPFQSEPTRASSGNSAESKPTRRAPNNYELFAQAARLGFRAVRHVGVVSAQMGSTHFTDP